MEDTCDEDINEVTVLIISYTFNLIKLALEKNVSQLIGERHKKLNS